MIKKSPKKTMAAALMLSLSLSACSAGNRQAQNETAPPTEQEAAQQTEEAQETAEKQTEEAQETAETEANATQETATRGIVTDSAKLTFPLGMEIQSDTFTGAAYLSPMIENEEIYHFPQTNNVTFAPGARSGWHTHGGMIMLVTGGVGYYQEEG